jgi:hypothetical protein
MYCGDHDHYAFMNEAFGLYAHVNVLQRDICPSATKFEAEILGMALDLFHAEAVADGEPAGLTRRSPRRATCSASSGARRRSTRPPRWSTSRRWPR